MTGLFFVFVCLLSAMTEAKVYERCALARDLKRLGLSGYHGVSLANWVCTAYYESRFNTRAVGPPNSDNSRDYGIFQINSRWWCDSGYRPTANGCRKPCSAFLTDNISADVECVKRIVRDPQGIHAWTAWVRHCKGQDVSKWIRGCGV